MKKSALIVAIVFVTAGVRLACAEWLGGTGMLDTATARPTLPARANQKAGPMAAPDSVAVNTGSINWETDYDAALDKAKRNKKLVMVDMYTDWCGWCKKLDRDTYSNKTVQETLAKNFVTAKINPEKSKKNAALAKQFGTRGYPHIVFLDDSGKKISEISGYRPAKDFQEFLDAVLKKAGK